MAHSCWVSCGEHSQGPPFAGMNSSRIPGILDGMDRGTDIEELQVPGREKSCVCWGAPWEDHRGRLVVTPDLTPDL